LLPVDASFVWLKAIPHDRWAMQRDGRSGHDAEKHEHARCEPLQVRGVRPWAEFVIRCAIGQYFNPKNNSRGLTMNLRLLVRMSTAVLVATVAACASAPLADRYVAPVQGATWTLQHSDSGSYGAGKSVVSSRMAARVVDGRELLAFENPQQTLLALPNGNWLGFAAPDGKMTVSFEPPSSYEWPLEVGKKWTRQQTMKFHRTGQEVPVRLNQGVEAVEQVTVPAGSFWTYRIRTIDSLGSDNVVWFAPRTGIFVKQLLTRSAQHPQGAGRRESELLEYKTPSRY
jgi:hypothetical protein